MADVPPKSDARVPNKGGEAPARLEKRAHNRYAFMAEAEVVELSSNTRLQVRLSELSLAGCYVETLNPLPTGTAMHVKLFTTKGVFETDCKVIYTHSQSSFGMGLAFGELNAEQKTMLQDWIAQAGKRF